MFWAVITAAFLQVASPQTATSHAGLPWNDCADENGRQTSTQQIEACSAIISAGTEDNYNLAVAHSNRALSYARLDRFEEAIIDFDRSIQLNPDNYWAIYNRAISSINLKNDEDALHYLDRAIMINPRFYEALLERGQINIRKNKNSEAIQDLDSALAVTPSSPVAHAFRGIALWNQGKTREAIQAFERAQRLDPDTPGVAENLQRLRAIQEAGPRREMTTYRDCVLAAASRLERSGERADIVASAAIETCRTERATFENAAQENWDWRMARRVAEISQEELTKAAQARVVELRSRRR